MSSFLLIFCLLFPFSLLAQESNKVNHLEWRWSKPKLNGQKITKQEFKAEIYTVTEAVPFYKKAGNFEIAYWTSSASAIGLLYLGSRRSKTYPYNYKRGFSIAGVICTAGSFYFLSQLNKNFKKAAKVYNEKQVMIY